MSEQAFNLWVWARESYLPITDLGPLANELAVTYSSGDGLDQATNARCALRIQSVFRRGPECGCLCGAATAIDCPHYRPEMMPKPFQGRNLLLQRVASPRHEISIITGQSLESLFKKRCRWEVLFFSSRSFVSGRKSSASR